MKSKLPQDEESETLNYSVRVSCVFPENKRFLAEWLSHYLVELHVRVVTCSVVLSV